MTTWPENLPGPNRTLPIEAGTNTKSRNLQSGRLEVRRFGSGAPDRATVVFRLFNEDVSAFLYFFDRQTNLGVNWFSAAWLPAMGYSDHKARILGRPKRKAAGVHYSDFSATLLIKAADDCPESDTFWLSRGTGGEGAGGESADGLVVVWGSDTLDVVNNCPANLYAVKVCAIPGAGAIVALKADKTVHLWGGQYVESTMSGWDALGGIVDIASTYSGFFYLTSGGSVGFLGVDSSGGRKPARTYGRGKGLRAKELFRARY